MKSERDNIAGHRKARKVFQVDVVSANAFTNELNIFNCRWVALSVMQTVTYVAHVRSSVSH